MSKYKNTKSLDDVFTNLFDDNEKINDFLKASFCEYLEDGDFTIFYRSLELSLKAKDKINSSNTKKTLDSVVDIKQEPKITTLVKILKELGFTLELKETA